jgi:hypothetical protein
VTITTFATRSVGKRPGSERLSDVKTYPTPASPGSKSFAEVKVRLGERSELATAGSTSVFTGRRSATARAETLAAAARSPRKGH